MNILIFSHSQRSSYSELQQVKLLLLLGVISFVGMLRSKVRSSRYGLVRHSKSFEIKISVVWVEESKVANIPQSLSIYLSLGVRRCGELKPSPPPPQAPPAPLKLPRPPQAPPAPLKLPRPPSSSPGPPQASSPSPPLKLPRPPSSSPGPPQAPPAPSSSPGPLKPNSVMTLGVHRDKLLLC